MRRVGGRGQWIPGLTDAITSYWRFFAESWPTDAARARVAALERGDRCQIDGHTVWRALFRADSPYARRFYGDAGLYELAGPDDLRIVGDQR